ncbi:unnamed protein product [Blepharisma stoltei]|uniref:USP domain-containing protein n=1 Tax=Blepharisma stoltei TaxID=1481888 RepID=A0AAU9IHJ8_9CILI|nr:unnamed protein product [Blepharisma stoltei]
MSYSYFKYFAIGSTIVGICAFILRPKLAAWWEKRKNKQNKKLMGSRDYQELEKWAFVNQSSRKSGIPNYGNTCYLNSVIQVLSSTPSFVDFISKSKAILFINLSKIFDLMFTRTSSSSFKPRIIQFLNTFNKEFPMVNNI